MIITGIANKYHKTVGVIVLLVCVATQLLLILGPWPRDAILAACLVTSISVGVCRFRNYRGPCMY